MSRSFRVKKVLNNNVVIAVNPVYGETVLIGKGIGFGKKTGAVIDEKTVEKCFIMLDRKEQEQYKQLLMQVDEELVEVINEAVSHIQKRFAAPVSEHIQVALTDHIGFAIKRMEQGMTFHNPFLIEIRTLYEKEYQVAEEIIRMIDRRLGIQLPEAEIGFIAMHIHSALTRRHLAELQQHSQLILKLIRFVESASGKKLDKKSLSYMRLITHLRCAIERTEKGEHISEPEGFTKLLRMQYPLCYTIAWKLARVMEKELAKPVHPAEVSYLTLHLQQLWSDK
ncbi:MAG: PRD domain-containing protein [Thermoactinomyces sp.]